MIISCRTGDYQVSYPWVVAHGLVDDLHDVINHVCGLFELKFKFLDELPYIIIRMRDRSIARRCLERRDALAARGKELHRITEYFFAFASGMRPLVEAYVAGAPMDERLSRALQPYEWLKFDEAYIEREHQLASKERQRAHGVQNPFVQATLQAPFNATIVDRVRESPSLRQIFVKCWDKFKLLACPYNFTPHRMRVPRDVRRLSFTQVVHRVYRCSSFSLTDVSATKKLFGDCGFPTAVPLTAIDDVRLKYDYINSIVRHDVVIGLPMGVDPEGPDGKAFDPEVPMAIVPADEATSREDFLWFKVVDKKPGRHKLIRTDESDIVATTMIVQKYEPAIFELGLTGVELFIHERPSCANILDLAPWASWRSHSTTWARGGEPTRLRCERYERKGTLQIQDCTPEHEQPAVLLIERLIRDAWTPGRDADHEPADLDDKTFNVKDGFSLRPAYFACLLQLSDLFAAGLSVLSLGQHNGYYLAALLCNNKALVLKDMMVKEYTKLMNNQDLLALPPPEEPDPGEFEPPPPPIVEPPPGVVAPWTVDPPADPSDTEWEPPPAPVEWFPPPPPEPPAPVGPVAVVVAPVVLGERVPADLRPEWRAMVDAWGIEGLPREICGRELKLECRGGGASAPRRRIFCSNAEHVRCNTSRSVRLCYRYGQKEVYGFLALWGESANAGPHSADRDSHMRYKPTDEDIHTYLVGKGLI